MKGKCGKMLFYILMGVWVIVLSGCNAAKTGTQELNIYAWSEYIPQTLLDNFSEQTGIQVNYDTYESNDELIERLEAGNPGYDIAIPSDYVVGYMIRKGMLETIDVGTIPNFRNIGHQFKNPAFDPGNRYSVPYQWGTSCLVVNTRAVTREITSWADLWDPVFRGRVLLLDDRREVLSMVLLVLGYDPNSTNPEDLDAARVKLAELMPNVGLMDSYSPKTALLAGEVWLGMTWSGEAALAHQENPMIDYVFPVEGCSIWFDNLVIPKGAPHKDAALAFINYVLSPEAGMQITMQFPYSNPNTAALELLRREHPDLYEAYMAFSATNPSDEEMARLRLFRELGEEGEALWDRIWQDVMGDRE